MAVPRWLHSSDVWESFRNTYDDSFPTDNAIVSNLPICELDCGDAIRLYQVMGAWCFSWDRVPKSVFFPLWRALVPEERRTAIAEYKYFAEELDEDSWMVRMYERDDLDLLITLPKSSIIIGCWCFCNYRNRCSRYKYDMRQFDAFDISMNTGSLSLMRVQWRLNTGT